MTDDMEAKALDLDEIRRIWELDRTDLRSNIALAIRLANQVPLLLGECERLRSVAAEARKEALASVDAILDERRARYASEGADGHCDAANDIKIRVRALAGRKEGT